jgi:hypothetical protein
MLRLIRHHDRRPLGDGRAGDRRRGGDRGDRGVLWSLGRRGSGNGGRLRGLLRGGRLLDSGLFDGGRLRRGRSLWLGSGRGMGGFLRLRLRWLGVLGRLDLRASDLNGAGNLDRA